MPLLVVLRWLWLAALAGTAGALAFRALEAGALAESGAVARRRVGRLAGGSLAAACLAGAVWAVAQAGEIAGAEGPGELLAALAPVAARTVFGRIAVLQLGLLLLAAGALRLPGFWGRAVPALAALAAAGLQAGHLHAYAMGGWASTLTVAVVLHLGAAALWLGGLPPLRAVIAAAPPAVGLAVARRFSARATALVAVLAATALYQGAVLSGGTDGLLGTAHGRVMLAKAALFACLLAMAARHRFRLTPALAGADPAAARAALSRGIAMETLAGLLVLLAAATLSALPPGMHMDEGSATAAPMTPEERG